MMRSPGYPTGCCSPTDSNRPSSSPIAAVTLTVCCLDLDGFKSINDRFGHDAGDQFLIKISTILRRLVRSRDSVARRGGDEFVLLLSELNSPRDCYALLERILVAIARPLKLGDTEHHPSASIGVTLYPQDRSNANGLLQPMAFLPAI